MQFSNFFNTLLPKYGWLVTNVPQVLHCERMWKDWFNNFFSLQHSKSKSE